MPKTQLQYDEEFRRDALEFYRTSTLPKKQIARELGVSSNSLREWDKRDRQAHGEVRRLSLENQHLRR